MLKDKFVQGLPANQKAIDCFEGLWYSKFPKTFEVEGGVNELFEDSRLNWALTHLLPKSDWDVLELGPLEGGHSYYLEKHTNIRSVTAIEANRLCWLRCLVTKEVVDLKRTRFLLGDFLEYLRQSSRQYHLGLALGVLYHMANPLELLRLLAKACDDIILWTQFVTDEQKSKWQEVELRDGQFTTTGYLHDYEGGTERDNFIGGVGSHAVWLTKDGILESLEGVGFSTVTEGRVGENEFGGEITLVATKGRPS